MKVCFFSDSLKTVFSYRSDLMIDFETNGCVVTSATLSSLFSRSFLFTLCRVLSADVLVVSNMRSILIAFMFFWKKRLFIVNGMGRFRTRDLFRLYFLFLVRFSFFSSFAFQNYADYRYFRRFCSSGYLAWVPGSGGCDFSQAGPMGSHPNFVVMVSRDSKIILQTSSIISFLVSFPDLHIGVFGLTKLPNELLDKRICPLGFVDRNILVENSAFHFSPSGYGEGIPHTLVDAICSGLTVFLERRNYIRYGFYRFQEKFEIKDSFIYFCPSSRIKDALSVGTVNSVYIELVKGLQDF